MSEYPDNTDSVEQVSSADVRLAAMNFLARREHSLLELRRKLKRRFGEGPIIDEQLSRLIEERLQSDVRFAESYARQRISRGYGPVRLMQELRERGVSESDIELGLEELEVDWYALASEVMIKKFGAAVSDDTKEKARRARFMQYRGFETAHYRRILQHPPDKASSSLLTFD